MKQITKNNSKEMKTVVETFVIEETAELIYDNEKLEEWNNLVSSLNLEGQTQIVQKEKSPVPFMPMNNSLVNVFDTLLPRRVAVKDYNISPIPVEILSLVSLSINENYFDKIEIWYDDKSPDPACIGSRYSNARDKEMGYHWNMEKYLIGKWADVRQSFEQLKTKAMKRYKVIRENELKKEMKRCQRELEDMDSILIDRFGLNNTDSF